MPAEDPGSASPRRSDSERIASNEDYFRRLNERIREGGVRGESRRFACECALLGCDRGIPMAIEEYERLRKDPRRFAVVDGHEENGERVVEDHGVYVIVEKSGATGEEAARRAPKPKQASRAAETDRKPDR